MLHQEWLLLQQQFEDYEKHSLLVKLTSVAVATAALISASPGCMMVIGVLWCVDMMVKTMQSRLTPRLLALEEALANSTTLHPAQLHGIWASNRGGVTGLLAEYSKQALKPTVAIVPVLLLVVMALVWWGPF